MLEIMEIIDEWETHTHIKKTKAEKNKGDKSYSERVRANSFCCAFKLGFLRLISKASLFFKSNLELALSIILCQSILRLSADVWKYETCYPFWYVPQF